MGEKKPNTDVMVFIICALCLISIFVSVFWSVVSISRQERAQTDPAGCSIVNSDTLLSSGKCAVKAKWEYYNGTHIVTEGLGSKTPDAYQAIPMSWSIFDQKFWGKDGKASYRLVLDGLPDGEYVLLFTGISPIINIYVNGVEQDGTPGAQRSQREAKISGPGRCEVVLEVTSQWLTGVYACPWLCLSGVYQTHRTFTNGVLMASLGGFATAFLFGMVLLHKLREKKQYHLFMQSFISIGIFYLCANFEMSGSAMGLYEYIPFEQVHLLVTAVAVYLGITTVKLQVSLYPDVYNPRASYTMACALFAAVILRLFTGNYFNMDILIACLVVVFVAYELTCTVLSMRQDPGLVYVALATVLVGIGISVTAINSTQHTFYGAYVILPVTLLGAILFYANFWAMVFARIEEAAARESEAKEKQMNAEIAYLTSQIQPHFQYNTLTMIQELCYTDPKKAADAIVKYSALLRRRVDFNKYERLVPFSDELECLYDYIDIQKMRFGDNIRFKTDIETEDFMIPPLSIQTLVENAVHHGLRKITAGGTVSVTVAKKAETVCITIRDDGAGFDVDTLESENQGSGIDNCRFRIESLLGGQVNIRSTVGEGTTVSIVIPNKTGAKEKVK